MLELAKLSIFTRLLSLLGVGFPLEGGSSLHCVQTFLGAHPFFENGYQKILALKRIELQSNISTTHRDVGPSYAATLPHTFTVRYYLLMKPEMFRHFIITSGFSGLGVTCWPKPSDF